MSEEIRAFEEWIESKKGGQTMSEETLKTCPKCEHIPELSVLNHKEITVEIRCKNCSIRLIQKYRRFSRDEAIKLTIASWNSRPIEDALRARVQELEAALNDIQCLSPAVAYTSPDSKVVELDYSDYCDYCQKIKELTEVALKKKAGE